MSTTSSEIPPVINSGRSIKYELTRWDIFVGWMTILLRNRQLQIFMFVAIIVNEWLIVVPDFKTRSLLHNLFAAASCLVFFLGAIILVHAIMGLANAFLLKQRGLVGQHILEITNEGLVERTEFNETLHRWPSICRIVSLCGYLCVYVSDNNLHFIPKRRFSPEEIASFEADLRARATGLKT